MVKAINSSYQFNLTGDGGGDWYVDLTKPGGEVNAGKLETRGRPQEQRQRTPASLRWRLAKHRIRAGKKSHGSARDAIPIQGLKS